MPPTFRLHRFWKTAIRTHGVSQDAVLRRAGLPLTLLNQSEIRLNTDQYFRLIESFDAESNEPSLGLRLGQILSMDAFDPILFATACSPNLEVALQRMSTYRELMSTVRIGMEWRPTGLKIRFRCIEQPQIPALLGMAELTFVMHWIREATRTHIVPLRLGLPALPDNDSPHLAYFGIEPTIDSHHSLLFSFNDAQRPFFNANRGVWSSFEPALRRRLSELEGHAPFQERVRVTLLELLPSGRANKKEVAQSLGVGQRTLQRRLRIEDSSFQRVLAKTREDLARHYITRTKLSAVEIAFLLDFDDPKSLYRAFHTWTGTTPEAMRQSMSV